MDELITLRKDTTKLTTEVIGLVRMVKDLMRIQIQVNKLEKFLIKEFGDKFMYENNIPKHLTKYRQKI